MRRWKLHPLINLKGPICVCVCGWVFVSAHNGLWVGPWHLRQCLPGNNAVWLKAEWILQGPKLSLCYKYACASEGGNETGQIPWLNAGVGHSRPRDALLTASDAPLPSSSLPWVTAWTSQISECTQGPNPHNLQYTPGPKLQIIEPKLQNPNHQVKDANLREYNKNQTEAHRTRTANYTAEPQNSGPKLQNPGCG